RGAQHRRAADDAGRVAVDEPGDPGGKGRIGDAVVPGRVVGRHRQRRRGDGEGGRVGGQHHAVVAAGAERAQGKGVGADRAGGGGGRAQRAGQGGRRVVVDEAAGAVRQGGRHGGAVDLRLAHGRRH